MDTGALLEEFQEFQKKEKRDPNPLLEQFLCYVAKTGEAKIPWSQFKSYFLFKMEKVIDDFHSSTPEQRTTHNNPNVEKVPFEEMKKRILKIVDSLNGIPFTIQRLCELLTEPKRNYTGMDKFLRGIEKNVMVVSCVYPASEKHGTSTSHRMNGVMFPGTSSLYSESRNVNGPSMPKQLSRPKLYLSSSTLSINGLPECALSKEPETTPDQAVERCVSIDPFLGSEVTQNRIKNRHTNDEEVEDGSDAENHKSKRLKVNKKEEGNDTTIKNQESSCQGTQKSATGPISPPTEACGKEADEENTYCESTVHQLQQQLKMNTLSERKTGESSSRSDGDCLPSVKLVLSHSGISQNLSTGGDAEDSNCTKTELEPRESD